MLYGYKEKVDNQIATIVSAADTVDEYDNWVGTVSKQMPHPNFESYGASSFMDHLTRDEFHGYKRPVLIVFHVDEVQRELFVHEWQIKQVQPALARDMQKLMTFRKSQADRIAREAQEEEQASATETEIVGRSLEEIHGLIDSDPWDKRTEEQKQAEADLRKKMKELRKEGKISDDSFGGADVQRKAKEKARKGNADKVEDGVAHVTDVRTTLNADGSVDIDNVLAQKWGGEIDSVAATAHEKEYQDRLAERKKGKRVFSPDDFAEALRGDGSADHLNMPADEDAIKHRREPGRAPVFSAEAEKARKEHQAQLEKQAAEIAAQRRLEDDKTAKLDHAQGVFKGTILYPDQVISRSELPERISKTLQNIFKDLESIPLKDYPFNSAIGLRVLLPSSVETLTSIRLIATENLETEGQIDLGDTCVVVASKKDITIPAWAVYISNNKVEDSRTADADITDESEQRANVFVVRIRP
jgi:hypothetical protein